MLRAEGNGGSESKLLNNGGSLHALVMEDNLSMVVEVGWLR